MVALGCGAAHAKGQLPKSSEHEMTSQLRTEKPAIPALPRTLSLHLVGLLRHQIITGAYKPSQPLREQDIEAEFGSSRGPVRESLRMLLQGGLVE